MGEIRDPIHGLIPVSEIEFKVIDSLAFQRLRNIKQLALAYLGFYGATHSRFEHCIGTMHIVSKIIDHLSSKKEINIGKDVKQVIRLTGLLHDIGHGPFSHLSENILEFYNKSVKYSNNIEEIHEEISRRIITEDKQINKIIGKDTSKYISELLKTKNTNPDYQHDIISGSIDADKMDYLLRDSYYAGVKYGLFDIERMINVLSLIKENKRFRLAINQEGIQTVEQYVLAKYFIANQVYMHKIRLITDIMVIEGIKNAIDDGNKELLKLYKYNSNIDYIKYYLSFDDQKAFNSVLNKTKRNSLGYKYFNMLKNRILLKRLYYKKFEEIHTINTIESLKKIKLLQSNDCDDLKKEIVKIAKLEKDFIHVVVYSLKNPLTQKSYEFLIEQSIRIKKSDKITTVLDMESNLFRNIAKDTSSLYISVFGLPKVATDKIDYRKYEKVIHPILINYFGG